MNKREIFLNTLQNIEPKINEHLENIDNKLKLVLLRKNKGFMKAFAIFLKNFFNLNIKVKTKTFFGRDISVYLADADASSLYFFGTLYGEELKIIKFLIKNLKNEDIFYDIGANFGFYTLLAQELIDVNKGEIHSFEPLQKVFKLLQENALINKFKNTYLNNLALSDRCGFADFVNREDRRHSGRSSLILKNIEKKDKIVKVKTITLEEYVKNHKPPTIMKIDVEGAEFLVLKGGEKILKENSPIILMECGLDDLHKKAMNFLLENEYKMYSLDNSGEIKLIQNKDVLKIFKGQMTCDANYVFLKNKF